MNGEGASEQGVIGPDLGVQATAPSGDLLDGGCAILVVSHNAANGRSLSEALEVEGFSCRWVTTGQAALRTCWAQTYDVVIVDTEVPDMPLADFQSELRRQRPEPEVLRLIGGGDINGSLSLEPANGSDHFRTPVAMARLLEALVNSVHREQETRKKDRLQATIARGKKEWEATCDAISDPIAIVHQNGAIQRVNHAFSKRFGLAYREAVGAEDWRVIFGLATRPLDWEARPVLVAQTSSAEQRTDLAIPGTFLVSQFPAQLDSGPAVVYILRDITEQEQMRLALEESRKTLEALLGKLPGMAYRCRNEPTRGMEFVSDGCLDLTECSTRELLDGKISFADLIHPDDRDVAWAEIQSCLADSRPFQLIYRIQCPSKAIRWVWEQGRGSLAASGEIETLEGFIADITARHRMEEQARHQEKMVALGRLAAGIAHEIGNPLASISGVVQNLQGRLAERPRALGKLALIQDQVARITGILRGMQDLSGRPQLEWARCSLNTVLSSAVSLVRFDRRAADVEIRLDLAHHSPWTYAIEDQLYQLFLNILLNALDAVQSVGATSSSLLEVSTQIADLEEGEVVIVEFRDDGPGIPGDALPSIFDPFFTTKDAGYGTGLGLAICHRIVEEHKGRIEIDRAAPRGTLVRIILPTLTSRPPAQ